MKLLIIIPAYNEAENIVRVVEELKEVVPQYNYLVVNDGSKDDTAALCREHGYHLLDLPMNLGLAGAVQAGIRYAYQHGYDAAIQIDGDGQHDPRYIPAMDAMLETGECDMVIGSRFVTEPRPMTLRMLGSRMISVAIRMTTGKKLSDPTSGMRMFNRDLMRSFAYEMNYGPEPDTVSYLLNNGMVMREMQVTMRERIAGESYLNMMRSIRYMVHMCMSILLFQRFRKGEKIHVNDAQNHPAA